MSLTKSSLIDAILRQQGNLKSVRMEEANIRQQESHIATLPQLSKDDVRGNLEKVLPKHLVPTNIGKYMDVAWPYYYETRFDYTATADIGSGPERVAQFVGGDIKTDSFKVGQEAAFILKGVYRAYHTNDLSGKGAPLKMTVRNAQSTRQFNDTEIQLQHIGDKGSPLKFDIPLLIEPNSRIEIDLKPILNSTVTVNVAETVNAVQNLIFYGVRVRSNDVDTITQLMFG
jgi:hypothetical protein